MKLFALCLAVSAMFPSFTSAQGIRPAPGAPFLTGARITGFDGQTFTVEHDGGISKVPFSMVPEAQRPAGFIYDPGRAEQAKAAAARQEWIRSAPKTVVEGTVVSLDSSGAIVSLNMRELSLPKRPDVETFAVHAPTTEKTRGWAKDQNVRFVGAEVGLHEYTSKVGLKHTVRSFLAVEVLP